MSSMHIPKLAIAANQIFILMKIARLRGEQIRYADVCAFVGRRHVITVRHDEDADDLHSEEESWSGHRSTRSGPDFILHAILNFVVESYFPVVQMIEDDVLAMEHRLDSHFAREEITRLFRLRREAIQLQHVLTRMSDVCGKLANLELPCIRAEARPYFRDVHDQLRRLDGMIGGLIDVIRAVFEASSLLEQQRQGSSMRKLAGWAAILATPAVIAEIYGMSAGYPIVVGVMVGICVALYLWLRKLRWV